MKHIRLNVTSCYLSVGLLVCLLIGCQPTPDSSVVVDRSEGVLEEHIIPSVEEGENKNMDVPESWSGHLEKGEGRVVIEGDFEIPLPEISNTPIYEVSQKEFDQTLLEELVNYFAQGELIFEIPKLKKNELEYQLTNMEARNGEYGHPATMQWLNSEIMAMKKLIQETNPKREDRKEKSIEWEAQEPSQRELVKGIDEVGDGFRCIIDNDLGKVEATPYDEQQGTTTKFVYQRGGYLSKTDVESKRVELEMYEKEGLLTKEWQEEMNQFLNQLDKELESPSIQEEYAIKSATETLAELGVVELNMSLIEPCVWTSASLEWNDMDFDFEDSKTGYLLQFNRSNGGLLTYTKDMSGVYYGELPGTSYHPTFFPEVLTIVVTEEGIQDFEWRNMAEKEYIVAENTTLLPFDKVIKSLANYLMYGAAATDSRNEGNVEITNRYEIMEVGLYSMYTNAYKEPANAWVVPTWVFRYKEYQTVDGREELRGELTTMIHAIDGGYIEYVPSY